MHINTENLPGLAFLAYAEMTNRLISEVTERFPSWGKPVCFGDLVYYEKANENCTSYPYWSRTVMLNPTKVSFSSISEAANILKNIQRNWAPYSFTQFRRSTLIQEKLPYINLKPKQFPFLIPSSSIGLYTLLDANTMIFSANTTSVLPAGAITLVEDHERPPSRAYLKIEEALVRFVEMFSSQEKKINLPSKGQHCFDAGACPGGWTWALRELDATVFAVDRSPLVESLMEDKNVTFLAHDAFTLKPEELCKEQQIDKFDWVFSDVICYPERLYEWVTIWLDSGKVTNMICTIKMQGEIDWTLVDEFASIPNSKVKHLCYNKHELTWFHCGEL